MLLNSLFFNPYHNQTFSSFFLQFFYRIFALLAGKISFDQLASDEIQVFVLAGVGVSSALVGTFLVLRRMTMLANSLSHTILIGIVLAYFLTGQSENNHIPPMQAMLIASLITGFLTTFLTEFLISVGRLQEDASTGLVFTTLFALGVISATILTRSAHIGIEAVMGNVDALHFQDLFWVYCIVGLNVLVFILFFKQFKLTTFDPGLAYSMGISPFLFNYLLMGQVSATTITSFRAVGVLLVLAFMTAPCLTARLLTNRLIPLLIGAAAGALFCSLVGVALTRHILTVYGVALSTAGVVVSLLLFCYLLALFFSPQAGLISFKRKKNS